MPGLRTRCISFSSKVYRASALFVERNECLPLRLYTIGFAAPFLCDEWDEVQFFVFEEIEAHKVVFFEGVSDDLFRQDLFAFLQFLCRLLSFRARVPLPIAILQGVAVGLLLVFVGSQMPAHAQG